MAREEFNIVIMHGQSLEYKKLSNLIKNLDFNPIIIKDEFSGDFLLKKVRKTVWKYAHCAIIIMTPDDKLANKTVRARQNVIFELGYCLAAFDTIPNKYWYNAVIIVKEDSVESLSDISGLEVFRYSRHLTTADLRKLETILEKTFKKAKKYHEELL
jgi:predicted nucleotide-binding protein